METLCAVLHSGRPILYSQARCARVPISSWPRHHLLFTVSLIVATLMGMRPDLFFVSQHQYVFFSTYCAPSTRGCLRGGWRDEKVITALCVSARQEAPLLWVCALQRPWGRSASVGSHGRVTE